MTPRLAARKGYANVSDPGSSNPNNSLRTNPYLVFKLISDRLFFPNTIRCLEFTLSKTR